jgi:hypothetical protein
MKKLFNMALVLCLLTIVSGYLSTAAAAFTVYTSESDFITNLDSYYLEDFSGYSDGSTEANSLDMGPVNGFGYTISPAESTLYSLDGAMGTNKQSTALEFTFTNDPVTGFGGILWPTNFGVENRVAGIDIELQMAGGGTQTYTIENASVDTFIGFTSLEAFTAIIVAPHDLAFWNNNFGAAEDLFVSADHLYAGSASPVPVPAAVWLLGSGLLGLVGLRRKAHK